MSDSLAFLQETLNACPQHDFGGQDYEIAGTLTLPDGVGRLNLRLHQLTPGVPCVQKVGGWISGLSGLYVDRGSDKAAGAIGVAAVHLEATHCENQIDNIEVTGHGKGTGIYFLEMHGFKLGLGLSVHDMLYNAGGANEGIFGIWLNQCSNFHLPASTIARLGEVSGGVTRYRQTDGITVCGSSQWSITRADVRDVGEGIDATGSVGNRSFDIQKCEIQDCDAFSIKLANSASNGRVRGNNMRRAGWSDLVISGPSEAGTARIENIEVSNNTSTDAGNTSKWPNAIRTGYTIMQGGFDPAWPKGISFLMNTANDTRPVGQRQMMYGFRNDNGTVNRMANCSSAGHTHGSVNGTFSYG